MVLCGALMVLRDLVQLGFGTANGRFVSFLDSLWNCFEFRNQPPMSPVNTKRKCLKQQRSPYHINSTENMTVWWRVRTFLLSFLLKYGSSTVVSVLVWRKPVVLKSFRHFASFAFCLFLIQFFPGDLPYEHIRASKSVQCVIRCGCTLYKLRKVLFVVEYFRRRHTFAALVSTMLLAVITVDGNSLARNVENVLSNRGLNLSCKTDMFREVCRGARFFWQRNGPLMLSAAILGVANAACDKFSTQLQGVAWLLLLGAKITSLVLMMHRNGVLHLVASIFAPYRHFQSQLTPDRPKRD